MFRPRTPRLGLEITLADHVRCRGNIFYTLLLSRVFRVRFTATIIRLNVYFERLVFVFSVFGYGRGISPVG